MLHARQVLLGSFIFTAISACGDGSTDSTDSTDPSGSSDSVTRGDNDDIDGSLGCSDADVAVFEGDPDLDLDAETPGCVMPRVVAGSGPGSAGFVEGVAECLSEKTRLSTGCTTCYARNAECSFKDCGILCLPDPEAVECRDCRCGRTGGADCFASLAECTGVPSDYCD